MNIIFGTTNYTKISHLLKLIDRLNLDVIVYDMTDIGWDRGEIEETGRTIEENSLIKAKAILEYCKDHNLKYPIITDDTGLFVDALYGEPGIYTSRYAEKELKENPELPKYQCVNKLLDRLEGLDNRTATFKSCVTTMMPDGSYTQVIDESYGTIAKERPVNPSVPYFYSVFILNGTNVPFYKLEDEELDNTFRFKALKKALNNLGE